jgi:hypothetical protein
VCSCMHSRTLYVLPQSLLLHCIFDVLGLVLFEGSARNLVAWQPDGLSNPVPRCYTRLSSEVIMLSTQAA